MRFSGAISDYSAVIFAIFCLVFTISHGAYRTYSKKRSSQKGEVIIGKLNSILESLGEGKLDMFKTQKQLERFSVVQLLDRIETKVDLVFKHMTNDSDT